MLRSPFFRDGEKEEEGSSRLQVTASRIRPAPTV